MHFITLRLIFLGDYLFDLTFCGGHTWLFLHSFFLDSKPQKRLRSGFEHRKQYYMIMCCKFHWYLCEPKRWKSWSTYTVVGRFVQQHKNINITPIYFHLFVFCFSFFSFPVVLVLMIWHLECLELGLINWQHALA